MLPFLLNYLNYFEWSWGREVAIRLVLRGLFSLARPELLLLLLCKTLLECLSFLFCC
jgi:hypothetical protein